VCALVAGTLLLGAATGRADLAYSIDVGSPSFGAVSNSDVLSRPFGGAAPPGVLFPAVALGLAGAPADEIDAMTFGGSPLGPLFFSVDAASVGIPGAPPDVASEAAALQAAGDIYSSPPGNFLFRNQDVLGELPAIAPGVIAVPPVDNLDALDVGAPTGLVPAFFSLAAGNVYGLSGADILIPGPAVGIPAGALGLAVIDDIDALHMDFSTGDIFFSLAPGSPSLFVVSPGCPAPPCSAADIFIVPGGLPPFVPFAPAAAQGLLGIDNIDALAFDSDLDGDTVLDSLDNCPSTPNPQGDVDGDTCGDACDVPIDCDGDNVVGTPDFLALGRFFGATVPPAPTGCDCDLSGIIGVPDFLCLGASFGTAAGPGLIGSCP
jgi:hypothetical protein